MSLPRSVAMFAAKCADCGQDFSAPHLGDFAYGVFLFFGELGTRYAILEAINHPTWRFVESIVGDDGDRIRLALSRIADPVEGQSLRCEHVCPICRSRNWESWGEERTGSLDVPEMTFVGFERLTDDEKRRLVKIT